MFRSRLYGTVYQGTYPGNNGFVRGGSKNQKNFSGTILCSQHFNWVTPDLAVGDIKAGKDLKQLLKNDIDVVVAAVPKMPLESDTYINHGMSLFHIPLFDIPKQDILQWFHDSCDFIQAHHESGRKVLVHCMAGISRSVSLVMAYLIRKNGWNVEETLRFVRKRRPCANPNQGFLKQLRQFYVSLQN
jgi:protein-tyrosine phosphatase